MSHPKHKLVDIPVGAPRFTVVGGPLAGTQVYQLGAEYAQPTDWYHWVRIIETKARGWKPGELTSLPPAQLEPCFSCD